MDPRIYFSILYLVVDVLYVATSKKSYETVVKRIQNSGFPTFTPTRVGGALLSYGALVLGWYIFATNLAKQLAKSYVPWLAGLIAGATYGFVVYAVFNGTLHVMFREYDLSIFARDLLWGMTWGALVTACYMWVVSMRM